MAFSLTVRAAAFAGLVTRMKQRAFVVVVR